jgi:glycosyltransferase involved in cell wall biosynthesis
MNDMVFTRDPDARQGSRSERAVGTARVLKFSYATAGGARTGRELLADLNSRALMDLCGERLLTMTVKAEGHRRSMRGRIRSLCGWLDGLTEERAAECVAAILRHDIDLVYIEGSNYGRLARYIRARVPSCRIVTFFHNVETRFFWGALRARPSAKAVGVLVANWLAERHAVKHSYRIICLNERDSALLKRLYHRAATDIHPMCVVAAAPTADDGSGLTQTQTQTQAQAQAQAQPVGLFVGGAFYANLEGVRWFARNVAPQLSCDIYVVGKGFERHREELAAYPNMHVVGTVEALHPWYARCSFVVAPIFDGSGMKTKVAEALMYGKPVIGTPEAFAGYESVADTAGMRCEDADAFVSAIRTICSGERRFDSERLKVLYEKGFSYTAKKRRFAETLADVCAKGTR